MERKNAMTIDDLGKLEGDDGGNPTENGGDGGGAGEKVFTNAEFDAQLKKKLAEKHSKMERELRKQLEAEIREQIEREADDAKTQAKKLEDMTALERAQYEAKLAKEENEKLKRERDLSEQMAVARRELADSDIHMGDELLAMFVSAEAEKTAGAIGKIKELWPEAVNEAVARQLKREPPKADKKPPSTSYGAAFAKQYSSDMNGGRQ